MLEAKTFMGRHWEGLEAVSNLLCAVMLRGAAGKPLLL
jgi:hypothetical protein